jgi:Rrf2 family protein
MKLSHGVEWGAHVCSLLAVVPDGRPLSGARLAEFYDLPPAYLSKHLRQLAGAGILAATPGPTGGYRLGRSADEITLKDIVEAINGNAYAFRCTEIRRRGPTGLDDDCYPGHCGVADAMWAAEEAWRDSLSQTTVADLVRVARREVHREQQQRTRAWLRESTLQAREVRS